MGRARGWGYFRGSGINKRLCMSLGVPRPWERVRVMEGRLSGLGEALQGVQMRGLGLLVLALPLGAPPGSQFLHHQKRGDDLHPLPPPGGRDRGTSAQWWEEPAVCPPVALWHFQSLAGPWGPRATSPTPAVPP